VVDGAGGFFTAFKAAMSVGKKGEEDGGDPGGRPSGGYPGAVEDHPGFNEATGTCSAHPRGCADAFGGGTPHPYHADEWTAQQRQGGAWAHPGVQREPEGQGQGGIRNRRAITLHSWGR
jgi:hypothetical protein